MEEKKVQYGKESEERIMAFIENDGGDDTMGTANAERQANPIAAIETISNLAGELEERIECLERGLVAILLPEQPRPSPEAKDPSHTEPTARSPVMQRLEATETRVRHCIHYLNSIIERLDL